MELVTDLAPGDAAVVGSSVNQFGFDLLEQLTDEMQNTVTSPVSAAALHLADSRDVRVGALLREPADTDDVTPSIANALWAMEGVPLEEDYLAFTRDSFGATVDEAGTEAAAVTGAAMPSSAGGGFRVDRPLAFTISDSRTGTILFLGAVADPSGCVSRVSAVASRAVGHGPGRHTRDVRFGGGMALAESGL